MKAVKMYLAEDGISYFIDPLECAKHELKSRKLKWPSLFADEEISIENYIDATEIRTESKEAAQFLLAYVEKRERYIGNILPWSVYTECEAGIYRYNVSLGRWFKIQD